MFSSWHVNVYQQFSASVVGAGSDTLVFTSVNDPGFTLLDDVSLVATTPEPVECSALLSGLVLLGLAVRRRVQKAV